MFDALALHVVETGLHLQHVGQLGVDAGPQFDAAARQVIGEPRVVDPYLVVAGELVGVSRLHVGLHEAAVAQGKGASRMAARLGQQRIGVAGAGAHAVVEAIAGAVDPQCRALGVGFDEPAIVELEMLAHLDRGADAVVAVFALGFAAIAHAHVRAVLEAVGLDQGVDVQAIVRQPGAVGADVVAVDLASGAAGKVQLRAAVAAHQAHQPLAIAGGQRGVGTEGDTLLHLVIRRAGTGRYLVFVGVAAHPATAALLAVAQLTHAPAQGARLAVPHGRRGAEQAGDRARARRCGVALAHQEPIVAPLLELVGERTEVHLPTDQAELRGAALAGMHNLMGVHRAVRVGAGALHQQLVIAAGLAADIEEVALLARQVGAQHEGPAAGQFAHLQVVESGARGIAAQVDRACVERQATDRGVAGHDPAGRVFKYQRCDVVEGAGQAGVVGELQVQGRVLVDHDVARQLAVVHHGIGAGTFHDLDDHAVAARQRRAIVDVDLHGFVGARGADDPDGTAVAADYGGAVEAQCRGGPAREQGAGVQHDAIVVARDHAVLTDAHRRAGGHHADAARQRAAAIGQCAAIDL